MSDLAGLFKAIGRDVFRDPVETKNDDGSTSLRIGFQVCTISKWVDDSTAQTIAAALNDMLDSGKLS